MWVIIDDPDQPAEPDTPPGVAALEQNTFIQNLAPADNAQRGEQLPHIDETLQLEAAPARRRWWPDSGLPGVGQLLLLMLLAASLPAQYLFQQQTRLLQDPTWRPLYQAFCGLAGCTLPPRTELAAIRSEELRISAHPTRNDYLIVEIQLFNAAPFAQPFPALELTFSDIRGQLVAADRLLPADYLPAAGLPASQQLSANTLRPLELTLINPGDNAANYQLALITDPTVHGHGLAWPASVGATP